MESEVASFTDVGKSLKRTAPEILNAFFYSVNLKFGRSKVKSSSQWIRGHGS